MPRVFWVKVHIVRPRAGVYLYFLELNLLRDMRLYTGAGIGGVNVVRVSGAGASSSLVLSLAFSVGAELLQLRKMYLDLNGSLLTHFSDVRGFSYYGNSVEGNITSLSIGLGIGSRF
jgi:hypothetical protein